MKKSLLFLLIFSFFLLTNCGPGFGPSGLIYTSTKIAVSALSTGGSKTGKSCARSFLTILSLGDASVNTAAKKAEITSIQAIDYEGLSVFFFYAELCAVVKGD